MAIEVEVERRCVVITTLLLLALYHVHARANLPAFDTDDRGGKSSNFDVVMVHVLEKHLPVATAYQVGTYKYQLGWNLIFSFKALSLSSGQDISCFETTAASSSSHGSSSDQAELQILRRVINRSSEKKNAFCIAER